MIEIVWEFVVKREFREQFELTYGPGGVWSKLFASSTGFRGITVLRDTKDPRRYLTIEVWDTDAQRAQNLAEHAAAHSQLEADLDRWVDSKSEIGMYSVLGQAAVRPRGKAMRAKGEANLRSGSETSW